MKNVEHGKINCCDLDFTKIAKSLMGQAIVVMGILQDHRWEGAAFGSPLRYLEGRPSTSRASPFPVVPPATSCVNTTEQGSHRF